MWSKKRLVLILLVAVLSVSAAVVILKLSSTGSSHMTKIGKITGINRLFWSDPSKPAVTALKFEDGEAITFVGKIENIEIGATYRIVFHEVELAFIGEWSGNFNSVDIMEKIE